MDYGDIKAATDPIERQLDHYCLNEIKGLEEPTSEMIAHWIWNRLKPALPMLAEIIVYETCTSRCEYRGGERAARRHRCQTVSCGACGCLSRS